MKLNALITAALAALSAFCVAGSPAWAQTIEVKDAWVRSTVEGQQGTGAFMKITARETVRLVGVSSSLAGIAEVHEMKLENDVMKMRRLPTLVLPAGKTVELKPGGYHVMLMDLKQPLPKGSTMPLTLRFKDAKGADSKVELTVPVSTVAPNAGAAAAKAADKAHSGHGEHKH